MEIKFTDGLPHQKYAINSIVKLFEGQNNKTYHFNPNIRILDNYVGGSTNGIRNHLTVDKTQLLENLQIIQEDNGLPISESINENNLNFTVEMETGTGKTYVYLKSIFELYKNYGFRKFIIVVPNLAIKEGVKKTLNMTKKHFNSLYDNIEYNYFVYDSKKFKNSKKSKLNDFSDINHFVFDNQINIMIINIDSFNKKDDLNIIYQKQESLNYNKPIDLIADTNPIVIIDEPQSDFKTETAKEAISNLNPLCTIGFSATPPKNSENYIYKLNAIDAYGYGLVKQIEVASIYSYNDYNNPYMLLKEVNDKLASAKIEMFIKNNKGFIKTKTITVKNNDDLSLLSNLDMYSGYIVKNIRFDDDDSFVQFINGEKITLDIPKGKIDDISIKREMIRHTIEEHLKKEVKLLEKGIKVMSLFFIDNVYNYRKYDEEGRVIPGIYAKIFEEEYNKLIKDDEYKPLLKYGNINVDVSEVHNGYFSVDKQNKYVNTGGNGVKDDRTYNLIMKDKERLLSLETPLRFIFSHSALREGWDNPNVFQICTLNETKSGMKKRQEIGRGLRLCVNQEGKRVEDKVINRLTIMANESYEQFAKELQTEIEKTTDIKFNKVDENSFVKIEYINRKGETVKLGNYSKILISDMLGKKYINKNGEVMSLLNQDIKNGKFELPEKIKKLTNDTEDLTEKIINHLRNITYPPCKDAHEKKIVSFNKNNYKNDMFYKLWDKIKYKSEYTVHFDSNELINKCARRIHDEIDVTSPMYIYTKAGYQIDYRGITTEEEAFEIIEAEGDEVDLPDIFDDLQNYTSLTRKTIANILIKSNTLHLYRRNPRNYIEQVLKIISNEQKEFLINGCLYTKIDDFYSEDLFIEKDSYADNILTSTKSPYNYTIVDSNTVEAPFQTKLEENNNIKFYIKLPDWFEIQTPIGPYTPDWAILLEKNNKEELYFVVETKGTKNHRDRRINENDKIKCGIKHFKVVNDKINYEVRSDFKDFIIHALNNN